MGFGRYGAAVGRDPARPVVARRVGLRGPERSFVRGFGAATEGAAGALDFGTELGSNTGRAMPAPARFGRVDIADLFCRPLHFVVATKPPRYRFYKLQPFDCLERLTHSDKTIYQQHGEHGIEG